MKIANITLYDNFINGQDSKPLVNLLMMEETYLLFEDMLNSDESLEAKPGYNVIELNNLNDRVYRAIFIEQYIDKYNVKVGKYEFCKGSKAFAIDTASMVSNFVELT